MNIKQKIILGVTLGFIIGSLSLWAATGFDLLTKGKVPVRVVDPLFGTESIEWKRKLVFGFDLAGPIAAIAAVGGGFLIFKMRTRFTR